MWGPLNISEQVARSVVARLHGSSLLVTGGLGLVGLNALTYITELRRDYGLKIELSLHARSSSALGLAQDFGNDFAFSSGDLGDFEKVSSIPEFDFILHAAGYGQPGKFMATPLATLQLNSISSTQLRKKAREGYLFVSSSEVYSGLNHDKLQEFEIGTTSPLHERAGYIEAKRLGEAATLVQTDEAAIVGNVARLALAYGPGTRLDDQRVLNELIVKGIKTGLISLKDAGQRLRTYCYVDDAIEQLFSVLIAPGGEVYNVGGNSSVSIRELAEVIGQELDVRVEAPEASNSHDPSPGNVNLDISKVQQLMNKSSLVPIRTGISRTVKWYRHLMGLEK